MMDTVVAIKPSDGMIAMHVRPILDQVYSILNHQASLPNTSASNKHSCSHETHQLHNKGLVVNSLNICFVQHMVK